MPTFLGHLAVALPINATLIRKESSLKILLVSLFCAVIPDLDFVGFAYGLEYGSLFGHRGFSHSIFFVLLFAYFVTIIFFPRVKTKSKEFYLLLANFFLIGLSHILLDAMTNGGLGVAFFSPFSNHRFFFPWRPIEVSAIMPQYFFALNGWLVLKFEFLYIVLPSVLYYFSFKFIVKKIK